MNALIGERQSHFCFSFARRHPGAFAHRAASLRTQARRGWMTTVSAARVDPEPVRRGLSARSRREDDVVVEAAKQAGATTRLGTRNVTLQPPVDRLAQMLNENDEFYKQFQQAIDNARSYNVEFVNRIFRVPDDYVNYANFLLTTPPCQHENSRNVYQALVGFYFVLDQEPLKSLQSPIAPSPNQQVLTPLSQFLVDYANAWGAYMNTEESAANIDTFQNDAYFNWNDYIIPSGGFKTFNDYFCRHVKPELRPINSKDDDRIVVCPTDSCLVGHWNIDSDSTIFSQDMLEIKGVEYSIRQLLADSDYSAEFAGGIFTHSFLNTYNYHRWHAPVKGKVVEVKRIQGQCYLNVNVLPNYDGKGNIVKVLNATDGTGYQFVQTRGLVVIDSPIGLVACLPIGMAQVSSVNFSVEVGTNIEKGQELGYFLFGGSDFVTVFQNRAQIQMLGYRNVQALMGQALARAHGPLTKV